MAQALMSIYYGSLLEGGRARMSTPHQFGSAPVRSPLSFRGRGGPRGRGEAPGGGQGRGAPSRGRGEPVRGASPVGRGRDLPSAPVRATPTSPVTSGRVGNTTPRGTPRRSPPGLPDLGGVVGTTKEPESTSLSAGNPDADKNRILVIRELVDTERTYSKSLTSLVEVCSHSPSRR